MHSKVTQIYAKPQLSADQLATFANALGAVVNSCIDVLDFISGDPDLEASGDELDGTAAEDDHGNFVHLADGPGCPIADPDFGAEEAGEREEGL